MGDAGKYKTLECRTVLQTDPASQSDHDEFAKSKLGLILTDEIND